MTIKAWWKSMTIWFNSALTALAAIVTSPDLMSQLQLVKAYVPDNIYKWLFLVTIVGNLLLRKKTNSGIGLQDGVA